jgi:hypothetical protein
MNRTLPEPSLTLPSTRGGKPYTRRDWRLDVNCFMRRYLSTLGKIWKAQFRPHPIERLYFTRPAQKEP